MRSTRQTLSWTLCSVSILCRFRFSLPPHLLVLIRLVSAAGFSFKGEVREPFKAPLEYLKHESRIEFEARKKMVCLILCRPACKHQ